MTMMRTWTLGPLLVLGGLATGLSSVAVVAEGTTYDDPFDYCAAVGTVDAPGPRYGGPAMPEALAQRLKEASSAPAEAPLALFQDGAHWRCMAGEVYACTVGANLPCTTKADPDREPSASMQAFCRDQPDAEVIPAVVTGRATIHDWRCSSGQPVIEGPPKTVDAAGFLADIWYRLTP